MKILMFSEDPKILDPQSEVAVRMREYAAVLGELHVVVMGGGVVVREQNLFMYPAGQNRFLRVVGFYKVARCLCRNIQFDVITAQGADDIGLAAYCIARRFKIPFQLQLHTDVLSPWYRGASWKEQVRYWIARWLIPRADTIRVVSERIKNSIMESYGNRFVNKIIVLPIFTDLKKYSEAQKNFETENRLKEYEFKMIAVGRFVEKEKNFLMLIEVMRDFIKICPKAVLVIVGDGPDKNTYEAKIKEYNLKNHIILEHWRDDLPSFYKSFDLFLLSSNYEGFGRVVLEAMASGLPVVMTDVGLAGEVVKNEENGKVIPVGDITAMLDAVIDLYKNPEKRKKFVGAGYIAVSNIQPNSKEEYLKKYRESFVKLKKIDIL